MPQEIERRFLVVHNGWRKAAKPPALLRQGYLSTSPEMTLRLRYEDEKDPVFCIKGRTEGISGPEDETTVSFPFAAAVFEKYCAVKLRKFRHPIPYPQHSGVKELAVDEFLDGLMGHFLDEIEFKDEGIPFIKPDWCGEDVTYDPRYRSVCLAMYGWPTSK